MKIRDAIKKAAPADAPKPGAIKATTAAVTAAPEASNADDAQ